MMLILQIFMVIVVVSLLIWLVRRSPLPSPFNWLLVAFLILVLCYFLLSVVGLVPGLPHGRLSVLPSFRDPRLG